MYMCVRVFILPLSIYILLLDFRTVPTGGIFCLFHVIIRSIGCRYIIIKQYFLFKIYNTILYMQFTNTKVLTIPKWLSEAVNR